MISQAVYQTEDRPKSRVCSLCLKLATVGDKITLSLSGREFHTLTTRLEKKWPSLADRVWNLLANHIPPWSDHQRAAQILNA